MSPFDYLFVGFGALVGVAPFALGVLLNRYNKRARNERWTNTAREAGLEQVEIDRGGVAAQTRDLQLRISHYRNDHSEGTRVEAWGPRLPQTLALRRVAAFLRRDRRDVAVGDDAFENRVSVQGPPALALALLDGDTRRAVLSLVMGRLELRGHPRLWVTGRLESGVLQLDIADRAERPSLLEALGGDPFHAADAFLDGEQQLPAVLRAAIDLAARLFVPERLADRLASNFKFEPEAGVRRKTLATLLREFPEAESTTATLRAALDDPDADVRVRAAILLGKEGRPVLLGVAGGEGAPDETTARAVAALGQSLSLVETRDFLQIALRTRRLVTARTCLDILGRHGGAEAAHAIAKVLLVEANEVGEAAAAALAATGDPSAEAPLLRALADGPVERRRAAAMALGRVGTRDAVQPLRDAERDSELRAAARQAIAQIHARLAGAEQGQLSLADGEPGRLSLADGEAGRLSLSDEKRDARYLK